MFVPRPSGNEMLNPKPKTLNPKPWNLGSAEPMRVFLKTESPSGPQGLGLGFRVEVLGRVATTDSTGIIW